jgi:hypothetical protein
MPSSLDDAVVRRGSGIRPRARHREHRERRRFPPLDFGGSTGRTAATSNKLWEISSYASGACMIPGSGFRAYTQVQALCRGTTGQGEWQLLPWSVDNHAFTRVQANLTQGRRTRSSTGPRPARGLRP